MEELKSTRYPLEDSKQEGMLFPVQPLRKNSEDEVSVGRLLQCPWSRLWQWR